MEERIVNVDINEKNKQWFLEYAQEVLQNRALRDANDGLIVAQRQLLWTMNSLLKMKNSSPFKKSASLVGSTMASSYIHGDASLYGVLCNLSLDFIMRYPLIEGKGSLGTQESSEMRASPRYTEAKPSKYLELMMNDFGKNVVDTKPTYTNEDYEPITLPALLPNALVNGHTGIGVSMSSATFPHNLTEVCDALCAYIKSNGNFTVDDVMKYIKGPDFSTPCTLINPEDIKTAFATGRSEKGLKIRAEYKTEGNKIIFTSLPYGVYRANIRKQIADKVDIFSNILEDFNDFSNIEKIALEFTLKPGVTIDNALNVIFANTSLQTSVSYNMNFIYNGVPKMCSMVDLLKAYVDHQEDVLIRATQYDLDKVSKRVHILEGLLIILNDIDTAIKLIKQSADRAAAQIALMKQFKLDELQADAVLDLKLARLTHMDGDELRGEYKDKQEKIKEYTKILADKNHRNEILIEKITEMKNKYGDVRRTKLIHINETKIDKEIAYVEPEKMVVIMSESGLIKRIPATSFRTQRRGGKGVKTNDDIVNSVIRTNTIDSLMVFTNKGNMYRLLVNNIPEGNNTSPGVSIKSLIQMDSNETPSIIYSIYRDTDAKFVLFVTKNGLVKKTPLDEYIKTKKKTGIVALSLREDDEIASINLIKDEPIILITKNGSCIKFNSSEISPTSRSTYGVKGITLAKNDEIISGLAVRDTSDPIAIFTVDGMGKRISNDDLITQKRGGKGVICCKGKDIADAALLNDSDNILIIGLSKSICISAKDIPIQGRTAIGVTVIKDRIQSVSKV